MNAKRVDNQRYLEQVPAVLESMGVTGFLDKYDVKPEDSIRIGLIIGQVFVGIRILDVMANDPRYRKLRYVKEGTRKRIVGLENLRVLDIGCGGSDTTPEITLGTSRDDAEYEPWWVRFLAYMGAEAVGVDYNPDNQNPNHPGASWELLNIDITDPEQLRRILDHEAFDLVTSRMLISLEENPGDTEPYFVKKKADEVVSPGLYKNALNEDWSQLRAVVEDILGVTQRATRRQARLAINHTITGKRWNGRWNLKNRKDITKNPLLFKERVLVF